MQPVKARENSCNPTKFVWQFCIGGTCHTSTTTSKIKRSNGICPAQKTPKSKTFKFVFLKWQPKPRKTFVIACFRKSAMKLVSAEFSSVLFSENRRGFKAFRRDNLPNGSVELLRLHKMMCPYKRTHLSYAATNFVTLGSEHEPQASVSTPFSC